MSWAERAQQIVVDGNVVVALAVAALAGFVSFASPCVVPLVPGYLSYLAAIVGVDDRDASAVAVKTARLRGRGGAGFPTGMTWQFTRAAPGDKRYVVCNADEGEPGTFKDRLILSEYADLVMEGMTIGARAIGASLGLIYLRAEYGYLKSHLEDVIHRRKLAGLLGYDISGIENFNFNRGLLSTGSCTFICFCFC